MIMMILLKFLNKHNTPAFFIYYYINFFRKVIHFFKWVVLKKIEIYWYSINFNLLKDFLL